MIQDVSIIHNLNFYSDHRMVRATLTSTPIKQKRWFHNDYHYGTTFFSPLRYIHDGDQLTTSFKELMEKNLPTQAKYEELINILQKDSKKVNPNKKVISDETQELLQCRKELLKNDKNQPM